MPTPEELRAVIFSPDKGDTWTQGILKGGVMKNGKLVGWNIMVTRSEGDFEEGQEIEISLDTNLIRKRLIKEE